MAATTNSGIYGFQNTVTSKWYVGSAVSLYYRRTDHLRNLRNNKSDHPRFQNAWNKYGENSFEWHILEYVTEKADLVKREQFWIDKLAAHSNGYNTSPAAGSTLGRKHSEETKARLAELARQQPKHSPSPEHRAAISKASKGRIVSEETRAKIRAAFLANPPRGGCEAAAKVTKGKPRSPETRAKQSAAIRAYYETPAGRENITKKQNPELTAAARAASPFQRVK